MEHWLPVVGLFVWTVLVLCLPPRIQQRERLRWYPFESESVPAACGAAIGGVATWLVLVTIIGQAWSAVIGPAIIICSVAWGAHAEIKSRRERAKNTAAESLINVHRRDLIRRAWAMHRRIEYLTVDFKMPLRYHAAHLAAGSSDPSTTERLARDKAQVRATFKVIWHHDLRHLVQEFEGMPFRIDGGVVRTLADNGFAEFEDIERLTDAFMSMTNALEKQQ